MAFRFAAAQCKKISPERLNWPGRLAGISEGHCGISKYFFLDHFSPSFLSQISVRIFIQFFVYCLAIKTYSEELNVLIYILCLWYSVGKTLVNFLPKFSKSSRIAWAISDPVFSLKSLSSSLTNTLSLASNWQSSTDSKLHLYEKHKFTFSFGIGS